MNARKSLRLESSDKEFGDVFSYVGYEDDKAVVYTLYRTYIRRYPDGAYRVHFGIDYVPGHYKSTRRGTLPECWREICGKVDAGDMKAVIYDICGHGDDGLAGRMLGYFRQLCAEKAENPDIPQD